MTAATDKTRPQVYVLSALVAVLAVMLYIRFGRSDAGTPAAAPAGTATQPSNQTSGAGGRGSPAVSDVKLDALKHEQAELADADRNPFRFQPKAAPPRPVERATPPPPTYVPPPIATGPPPPPPIPLKLVGLLTPPGTPPVRYAVLSDARGTPFYGKEGDLIEGRYRVLRIAADSIDLAYADGRGQQTLRLTPQ
jgi:hypothetical protein